jgi:hypothetical protein
MRRNARQLLSISNRGKLSFYPPRGLSSRVIFVGYRGLSSLDHPGDQSSRGETCREGRRHNEHRVTLDALARVIQKFFRGVAALFRGTPHCSCAIRDCVGNCAGCARGLVSRLSNVIGRSFEYSLRHGMLLLNLPAVRPVLQIRKFQGIVRMPTATVRVNDLNDCSFLYILGDCAMP